MPTPPTPRRRPHAWLIVPPVVAAAACTADHYRRDADREVDAIVDQKEERLFGKTSGFSIETARDAMRVALLEELARLRAERQGDLLHEVLPPEEDVPIGPAKKAPSDEATSSQEEAARVSEQLRARLTDVAARHAAELAAFEVTAPPLLPGKVLTLREALEIASDNSREYQAQKEQVYLVALDLTFQRYLFEARFGVSTSYDWVSLPSQPQRQRDGTLTTDFSITKQLASGGLLVLDFTNSIIKRFTGFEFSNGTNHDTSSVVDLSFSQPILKGFGADIVQEPLIQSERNAVYQLRAFERFRQEFAVTIARDYYNLVRQIDQIENARRSYVQFIDAREQSEALAVRGRRSQIQLDQAAQSELSSRNSWIVAQRNYQDALDRFKLTLGLPIEANLALDPAELEALRATGLPRVKIGESRAIAIALDERLDHVNAVEQLEDRDRQIRVAEDDLRAALDLDGSVAIPTADDSAFGFRGSQAVWRAGASLDLPVDKLAERNAYREALIRRDSQARAVALSEDEVKQSVRDALRRIAQLRETYRIADESVDVAERRVQSTALTLRMGRIQIRDALDATDALNNARNALTTALVDYQVGRLELARDMGLLELTDEGIQLRDPPPERTAAETTPAGEPAPGKKG